MEGSKTPWFQFMVNEWTREQVLLPDRFAKLLKNITGKFIVLRGYQSSQFPVTVRLVETGETWKFFIVDGWKQFLEVNDIRNGDVVELFYFGSCYFWVRSYRNGVELKDSSDDAESDSSDEESNINDYSEDNLPFFNAKFTDPYIKVGRLYVPAKFAREYLNGFPPSSTVQLVHNTKSWNAKLMIKYDQNKNIVNCKIHKGVGRMVKDEGFQPGRRVRVEFYGDLKTPLFHVHCIDG